MLISLGGVGSVAFAVERLDLRADRREPDVQRSQHASRGTLALAHQPQKEMFGADVAVTEPDRFVLSESQDALGAVVEAVEHSHSAEPDGQTHGAHPRGPQCRASSLMIWSRTCWAVAPSAASI